MSEMKENSNKRTRTTMDDEEEKDEDVLLVERGDEKKNAKEKATETESASTLSASKNIEVIEFNIITGTYKYNEYARMCLLVPKGISTHLLEALETSDNKFYNWTVDGCDDDDDDGNEGTIVKDLQTLPSSMFQTIRSITVEELTKFIAEGKPDGNKKSDEGDKDNTKKSFESEILDWLIHGEDYFSVKYVVLKFLDGQKGEDGYSAGVPFKITKKEHLVFYYEYAKSLCEICEADGGCGVYLEGYDLLDRPLFLKGFSEGQRVVTVDESFLTDVKEAVDNEDDEWAFNNRHLTHYM